MILIEKVKQESVIILGVAKLIETIKVNGKLVTFIDKSMANICQDELSIEEQGAAQNFVNTILRI